MKTKSSTKQHLQDKLKMRSYTFKVVLKPDKWPDEPDSLAIWRAYIPALPSAHAWGDTPKEALENLRNAVDLIIEDMLERGDPISQAPPAQVTVSNEILLTINI
jgi:predicted RNase H-like HicB family nuclease